MRTATRITTTAIIAATTLLSGLITLSAAALAADAVPGRGLTQEAVRQQYGAPDKQVAPVGNPPISRWVYDDFTVYFEGRYSIHTVQHRTALTTAPATPQTPQVTGEDQLPVIEEIDGTQSATQSTAESAAGTKEPSAAGESSFRFDPASGRIIEYGPDGKPVASPTAQPAATTTADLPAPVSTDDSNKASETETTAPAAAAEETADDPSPAPASAVAPASSPAAKTPAPAATTSKTRPAVANIRFDPATGRMVELDANGNVIPPEQPPQAETAAPVAEPPAAQKAATDADAAQPEADSSADSGGQEKPAAATAPAAIKNPADSAGSAADKPSFRFDPATGRIVMDEPGAAEAATETTTDAAAESAPVETEAAEPAADSTGQAEPTKAPEQPAEPTPAPATDQPAASEPTATEESEPEASKAEQGDGGFRLQW